MTLLDSFLLGLLQGITEFLPISSDGHLVLLEAWLKLPVEELKAFDVVLHLGTLLAMVVYFWHDLWAAVRNVKLAGWIVVGSIPAVIAGLTLEDWIDTTFRHEAAVFSLLLIMGLFYVIVEAWAKRHPTDGKTSLSLGRVFVIGVAQAFALLQGISRSGSTIGTGLLVGLTREQAARFSFVLGTPVIAGAVALKSLHVFQGEATLPSWDLTLMGLGTSLVAGYLSVVFLMKFLKKHSLNVFAIYLFILGGLGLLQTLVLH